MILPLHKDEEFVKKVYASETDGPRKRGMPVVRWKDRAKNYIHEKIADRGRGIELSRKECVDRERRRLLCHGHPLGEHSWRERSVRDYRYID